jgi:spore maturation protein CgeB
MQGERYLKDANSLNELRHTQMLPVDTASNGMPTFTCQGVRLHSYVNPMAEALVQIEEQEEVLNNALLKLNAEGITCVVLGPGLGYIIEALNKFAAQHNATARMRVICVELEAGIAQQALTLCPWTSSELDIVWWVGHKAIHEQRSVLQQANTVIFRCTAGYRQNRAAYDAILQEHDSGTERTLRILVPTPLYGGSYPIALHCADALRDLGHEVEVLDFAEFYALYARSDAVTRNARHRKTLQGLLATAFAEFVVARALDWKADLVWAVAQTPLTPPALGELRHSNIATALWFVEDFRLFTYWREVAPFYDAIFTIQRGDFHDQLHDIGAKHVCYLPVAANPAVHRPLTLPPQELARYGSDVAFVGAGYHNRQQLFAKLAISELKIWGNDWPSATPVARLLQEGGRRVTAEETAKIYSATKINLNIHSSVHMQGIDPHGDFVNPRTMEIAACGGFQITDWRSELPDLFDENSDICVVKSESQIAEAIRYYLEHDDERQTMAERARRRVLREHTYGHRMKVALDFLLQRLPALGKSRRSENYVSSLKKAVADDQELTTFLSQFRDDQTVDLDDIVGHIKLGAGPLTRAEGLFLLMKEFRDWGREKGVIQ